MVSSADPAVSRRDFAAGETGRSFRQTAPATRVPDNGRTR